MFYSRFIWSCDRHSELVMQQNTPSALIKKRFAQLGCVLGSVTVLSMGQGAIALPALIPSLNADEPSPSNSPTATDGSAPQPSSLIINQGTQSGGTSQTQETALEFATDRYRVRVYRQNGQLFMNLFDMQTQVLEFNGVPAEVAPRRSTDDNWRSYVNSLGEFQAYARSNPNGDTELEFLARGQQTYIANGADAAGSDITNPPASPPNQAQENILMFDTDDYAVRVYRQNGELYMNLFDKRTTALVFQNTPAEVMLPRSADDNWRSYVNSRGEFQAFARIAPNRATELEIRSNGVQTYRANGHNATGADTTSLRPISTTGYMGNDFAVPTRVRTIGGSINLREQPSTTSAIATQLPECTLVNAVQKIYSDADQHIWYRIETSDQREGWIRGDLLSMNPSQC